MTAEKVPANQNATQAGKGFVNITATLVTDPRAAELMQPAEGAAA